MTRLRDDPVSRSEPSSVPTSCFKSLIVWQSAMTRAVEKRERAGEDAYRAETSSTRGQQSSRRTTLAA